MKLVTERKRNPEIPIIPLMDILAILLIFFIVTTTFKEPRPALDIDLPTVKDIPSIEVTDSRSILAVDKKGVITVDGVQVEQEELADYLKSFKNVNPSAKLELEADQTVSLSKLFAIWEALTQAEIEIKEVPARIKIPVK